MWLFLASTDTIEETGARTDCSAGKVEAGEQRSRKTPHQQVMSKLDRRNQARQKQQTKHREHMRATSIFSGSQRAARQVAVIPLCADVDSLAAVRQLNNALDLATDASVDTTLPPYQVSARVDRFKQNLSYTIVDRNLFGVLEACRVADFVVFLLSSQSEVDDAGETMIRAIEGQGVPDALCAVQVRNPLTASSFPGLRGYCRDWKPTMLQKSARKFWDH